MDCVEEAKQNEAAFKKQNDTSEWDLFMGS